MLIKNPLKWTDSIFEIIENQRMYRNSFSRTVPKDKCTNQKKVNQEIPNSKSTSDILLEQHKLRACLEWLSKWRLKKGF